MAFDEKQQRRPPHVEWHNPDTDAWEEVPHEWGFTVLTDQMGIYFTGETPPPETGAARRSPRTCADLSAAAGAAAVTASERGVRRCRISSCAQRSAAIGCGGAPRPTGLPPARFQQALPQL